MCCATKTDTPWVTLQQSPASLPACTSPGTAARLSPARGHQAAGLIQPQTCSTALLSQSPDHKQPVWGTFWRNWRRCCLQHPLTKGCSQGLCTLLPSTLLTHVPQGIPSAITLTASHMDIDTFAAGTRVLCPQCGFLWLFSLRMSMKGVDDACFFLSGFPIPPGPEVASASSATPCPSTWQQSW